MINKTTDLLKKSGLGFVGGILGALGGTNNSSKLFRRLGIPILITIIASLVLNNWLVLSIMSLYVMLTIGYGIPDGFIGGDTGSPLGRFWYNLFSFNWEYQNILANVFTRGTVALFSCLTFLSIPIIKSNWVMYIIGSIVVISVYSSLSWRTLGSINLFNRNLTWSEIIPYSVLTTFAMFLIF